jgi:hypothetical protein
MKWVLKQADNNDRVPTAELRYIAEQGVHVTKVYLYSRCYFNASLMPSKALRNAGMEANDKFRH